MTERVTQNIKEVYFDTIVSIIFLLFFFIKLIRSIVNFTPATISLFLWLVILLFLLQILNIILYHINKQLVVQLILTFLSFIILAISCIFSILSITKFSIINFILFLSLVLLKAMRITIIILNIIKKKNKTIQHFEKKVPHKTVIFGMIIIFIIILPTILSPVLVYQSKSSSTKIEYKENKDIQLSFYATIDSYNYLTNTTILNLLNGSSHPGDIEPIEILLLIRESHLLDIAQSKKLAEIITNCSSSNIKVWTWFIYTFENGYYPSWEDSEHLEPFKLLFDNWVVQYSLNIEGILFDNELDHEFYNFSFEKPFKTVKRLLDRRNLAKNNWSLVLDNYELVIDSWRNQGYQIALVGSDLALIDTLDRDIDIQQTLGIVNFPVNYWDRVSIMMYRYCPSHFIPLSQNYLLSLGQLLKSQIGSLTVAALGCMGYGCYQNLNEIMEDIALMKFLDYNRVELFEFGAFFQNFGYEGLMNILNCSLSNCIYPEFNIQKNSSDSLYFLGITIADVLLDFF
ncbi:MAG: hypothetical protein FK730_05645 [Asgard group archaeon]|nr:hypothetical protein [Asgard group archaeon]